MAYKDIVKKRNLQQLKYFNASKKLLQDLITRSLFSAKCNIEDNEKQIQLTTWLMCLLILIFYFDLKEGNILLLCRETSSRESLVERGKYLNKSVRFCTQYNKGNISGKSGCSRVKHLFNLLNFSPI